MCIAVYFMPAAASTSMLKTSPLTSQSTLSQTFKAALQAATEDELDLFLPKLSLKAQKYLNPNSRTGAPKEELYPVCAGNMFGYSNQSPVEAQNSAHLPQRRLHLPGDTSCPDPSPYSPGSHTNISTCPFLVVLSLSPLSDTLFPLSLSVCMLCRRHVGRHCQ